jgi:hypothetical protein
MLVRTLVTKTLGLYQNLRRGYPCLRNSFNKCMNTNPEQLSLTYYDQKNTIKDSSEITTPDCQHPRYNQIKPTVTKR